MINYTTGRGHTRTPARPSHLRMYARPVPQIDCDSDDDSDGDGRQTGRKKLNKEISNFFFFPYGMYAFQFDDVIRRAHSQQNARASSRQPQREVTDGVGGRSSTSVPRADLVRKGSLASCSVSASASASLSPS